MIYCTVGLRFLYLAVPVGAAVVNEWAALVSSVVVVLAIYYLDSC